MSELFLMSTNYFLRLSISTLTCSKFFFVSASSFVVFSFTEFSYLVSESRAELEICWLDSGLGELIANLIASTFADADISPCYNLVFII